jgi:hypothetical protein
VQARKLTSLLAANGGVYDDGEPEDYVGASVSMSADGTTIVVGVPRKRSYTSRVGAAYVFLRPNPAQGGWSAETPIYLATKLMRADGIYTGTYPLPVPGRFGASVSTNADGSTIVVGDPEYLNSRGKAFVFVRPATPGGWSDSLIRTETASLTPSYGNDYQFFGTSVAMNGNGTTVVVGAPYKCTNWILFCDQYAGAAHVFVKPPQGWINATENAELKASTAPSPNELGWHVSVSDDGATVAASSFGQINVFIEPAFWFCDQTCYQIRYWTNTIASAALKSNPLSGAFPSAIAMSGDGSTIVGTLVTEQEQSTQVFERPSAGWADAVPTAKLTPPIQYLDVLASVAISANGRRIVVGVNSDQAALYGRTGAAYVYAKPSAGWRNAYPSFGVAPSDAQDYYGNGFGLSASVNADGTEFVIGSPYALINQNYWQGAAYVFVGPKEAPMATISPSTLTFGSQPVGTTSASRTFTVTNIGEDPVHVFDILVFNHAPFTTTKNCVAASPLAPGGSCTERVQFAPLSVGAAETGILVDSDVVAPGDCCLIVKGTGIKVDTTSSIVSASANPALVGQPVAVNFSVAPTISTTLTRQGTVTVQANTGESCTADVAAGSCNLVFTTPIDRVITASYSGDANFNASTSPKLVVNKKLLKMSARPLTVFHARGHGRSESRAK